MFTDAKRYQDAHAETATGSPEDLLQFGSHRLTGAASAANGWAVRAALKDDPDPDHLEVHLATALTGIVLIANGVGLSLERIMALSLAHEKGRLADRFKRAGQDQTRWSYQPTEQPTEAPQA